MVANGVDASLGKYGSLWLSLAPMRIIAAALLLSACDRGAPRPEVPRSVALECAVDGEAAFAKDCTVRRASTNGGALLTITAPDGGFRRLEASADGMKVVVADGAEPAVTTRDAAGIEVRVADDRYRFPAATP